MSDYFEIMKMEREHFTGVTVSEVVQHGNKWQYSVSSKTDTWFKQFPSKSWAERDREKFLEAVDKCQQLGSK